MQQCLLGSKNYAHSVRFTALCNPKVYYVHKNYHISLPEPVNPAHYLNISLPKIYFNIILPSTCRSSKLCTPFKLSNQHFVLISHGK
jgi:hypothetical protein